MPTCLSAKVADVLRKAVGKKDAELIKQELGKFVENAAAIEIISYHEDGQDEMQLMFVGPTPEAILDAQRRHMLQDVGALLARHFDPVKAFFTRLLDQQGNMLLCRFQQLIPLVVQMFGPLAARGAL